MSQEQTQSQEAGTSEGSGAKSALTRMMHGGRSFSSHERNCCYLNTGAAPAGAGRFANISAVSGLDYPDDGRAVALVDWDHDGDLDMWISNRNAPRLRLMRNDVPKDNHFLALRLEGNGKTTNRDAIGARVEIVLRNPKNEKRNPKSIKTLRAGEGFLAQSSKWLHFGLGASDDIEKVTVHWPGGAIEQFKGIDADHRYRLVQGTGAALDVTMPTRETKLVNSVQDITPSTQVARIPLVELLVMPKARYVGFDGRERDLPTETGRLLLVNLWASWCGPCLAELREISDRHEELKAKGIDILALSVDGLGEDDSTKANAARMVSEGKFPFRVGQATSRLIEEFQNQHNLHVPLHRKLPLPSSFLIDRQGRLAVIYKGPVSIDDLLKDAAHSQGDRYDRLARSAPLVGKPLRHPQIERKAVDTAEFLRFLLAQQLKQSGQIDEAVRQYADVLRFKPDSFMAHSNLGDALRDLGRDEEAGVHFRQAIRIKPDDAIAYYNLANILQSRGKLTEAVEHFRHAVQIDPKFAAAHKNLGLTLQGQGKIVEAIGHFQQALRIKPDDASVHTSLGFALKKQGKIASAIEHYQLALRADPDLASAHNNLANALLVQRKIVEAIEHYQRAVQIKPDYAEAHFNLANSLQNQGEFAEAIKHHEHALRSLSNHPMVHSRLADAFRDQGDCSEAVRHYLQALALKPDLPQALNNLARIRATHPDAKLRDGAQAVELAERCCQLTSYRVASALDTLAAAYAEVGRFDDAIKWQIKAIELARETRKTEFQIRLAFYKTGKPYRDKP